MMPRGADLAELRHRAARAGRVALFAEEDAVPDLAALLADLPESVSGFAFAALRDPAARPRITAPSSLCLRWIGGGRGGALLHRLELLAPPASGGPRFVWFAAGGSGSAAAARALLLARTRFLGQDVAISACAGCPLHQAVRARAVSHSHASLPSVRSGVPPARN